MRGTRGRVLMLATVLSMLAVSSVAAAVGGFASPLFGLATAPNGDILVADAGAGIAAIADGQASTDIPVLTAITFGKQGGLWATRNALIADAAEVVRIR